MGSEQSPPQGTSDSDGVVKFFVALIVLAVVFFFHQANVSKQNKIQGELRQIASDLTVLESLISNHRYEAQHTYDLAVRKYRYMQTLCEKADWMVATCRSEYRDFTPSEAVRARKIVSDYVSCTEYLASARNKLEYEKRELESLYAQHSALVARYNTVASTLGGQQKAVAQSQDLLDHSTEKAIGECIENSPSLLRKIKLHL